jgi:amino acid transporter
MLGSLLGAGLFFTVVSYAVVLGYGLNHLDTLAAAQAPLDSLARDNVGPGFAGLLDVANAISAFSGILGSLTAMVRLLFALGRAGLAPSLAVINLAHRTPARAVWVGALFLIIPLCATLTWLQPGDYYGYLSTIAALAMILVYAAVTVAEAVEAIKIRRLAWSLAGITGTIALAWSLLCSITPVPAPPANWWPYLVLAWVAVGAALPVFRPALRSQTSDGGVTQTHAARDGGLHAPPALLAEDHPG